MLQVHTYIHSYRPANNFLTPSNGKVSANFTVRETKSPVFFEESMFQEAVDMKKGNAVR